MSAELPNRVVAAICFVGRGGGQVKALDGFRKGHHSIPDAANPTTNGFLAKICAHELAAEAERLFQDVRTGLGYKRKDIALTVSSPVASLEAKDFAVEMLYALEDSDPSRYTVTTALRRLQDADLARTEPFVRIFSGRFSELSFELKKGVRVDAVIDAIEGLDGEHGLRVDYPSDCRECTVRVPEVEAEVRCTGATLDLVFARGGSPAELIDAFGRVRGAFQISKVLAGLIG